MYHDIDSAFLFFFPAFEDVSHSAAGNSRKKTKQTNKKYVKPQTTYISKKSPQDFADVLNPLPFIYGPTSRKVTQAL